MGTLKAGIWIVAVAFFFTFFFQNFSELQHPVTVGLNLYFGKWASSPIQLWVLLILFFLFGFAVSSLFSAYERIMLKRELRVFQAGRTPEPSPDLGRKPQAE